MVLIITGASHTGKTLLAQRAMERLRIPYLSIDHLKMGLIRSGQTELTPYDDEKLTPYLWSIVEEMVKTAIENGQSLIVEGCYVPFDWADSFSPEYLKKIRYLCLVMSEDYIRRHFSDIQNHANAMEKRLDDDYGQEDALRDNAAWLQGCRQHGCPYYLIDGAYSVDELLEQLLEAKQNP